MSLMVVTPASLAVPISFVVAMDTMLLNNHGSVIQRGKKTINPVTCLFFLDFLTFLV